MTRPLEGVRVLDFSTLLPGPMATLLLAEAGAEVIKIERPGTGEDMRHYAPRLGTDAVNFGMLNRGKRSIAIDLKAHGAVEQLAPLLKSADVLVEQFRPGVMDRLGLGYEALKKINPRLVYCSLTGYGQNGPRRDDAAHDLNYIATSGLLNIAADSTGAPVVPMALVADIAGGAYPAVMNISFALLARARTGEGCYLDVSMADSMFAFLYWAIGAGEAIGHWPRPGGELISGGSPRYQIYRTKDDKFLSCAPLEQKFWDNFCAAIQLAPEYHNDRDWAASTKAVAEKIRTKTAAEWEAAFAGKDVCVAVVKSIAEAMRDPHFIGRGLFAHKLAAGGREITATPVPVAPTFRATPGAVGAPVLGEANKDFGVQ
jgi:crotonobetainyl-CoA:carnitine CoA-transferase CaiB-like acyl-CoA transferase